MAALPTLDGAGILLIEYYKGSNVFTLFGKTGKTYEEIGGLIDPGETPQEAASREGSEETGNLVKITPSELTVHGKPVRIRNYMAYIIYINGLSKHEYDKNTKHIQSMNGPHCWRETNSMVRVRMETMFDAVARGSQHVNDLDGNTIFVRDRTMSLMAASVSLIRDMIQTTSPLIMRKKIITKSRLNFLSGTTQFRLVNKIQIPQPVQTTTHAIYIIPQPQTMGQYITLVDFSEFHPSIENFFASAIKTNGKQWTINQKTIKIAHDNITFSSNTLDDIAIKLSNFGFTKINSPMHSGNEWRLRCTPQNIMHQISKMHWTITHVKMTTSSNGNVISYNHRQLFM